MKTLSLKNQKTKEQICEACGMKSFTNWTDTESLDICLFHTCGNMVCCVLCHICNLCVYLYYIFSTNRKWVVMCVNRFEATAQSGSDDAFRDLLDSTAVFASYLFKADFQNKKVLFNPNHKHSSRIVRSVAASSSAPFATGGSAGPLLPPVGHRWRRLLRGITVKSVRSIIHRCLSAVWRRHQVTEVSQRWVAVSRHELVVSL